MMEDPTTLINNYKEVKWHFHALEFRGKEKKILVRITRRNPVFESTGIYIYIYMKAWMRESGMGESQ
jgi:hypothetical protein